MAKEIKTQVIDVITVKQVSYDFIFRYAEKKYGIHWNPCNDIFFGNAFDYNTITDYYVGDWPACVSFCRDTKKKASDYTVEEVLKMNNSDKSYVITSAFFEENGFSDDDEIQIDAR